MEIIHKIIFMLLVSVCLLAGRAIHIYDIWTGQPVSGAKVYTDTDTLISSRNGYVDIKRDAAAVIIDAENYFMQKVIIADLEKPLVYLEPYDYTDAITVVRPKEPDMRLAVPSHISHINLNMTDNLQPLSTLLNRQSGIAMKSYGGYGQLQTISLRGMDASQTQTLLDGIPLNSLQMGNLNFSSIAVNALQGVDIYRGGNYMFGGNGAIGGVINLQSVKPQAFINYNLFYQNASWNNNLFSGRLDVPIGVIKQSLFFEQSSGDNNYSVEDGEQDVALQNRDYRRYHLNYNGEISISPNNTLELFVSSYKNEGGAPAAYINENTERANRARISNDNTLSRVKFKQFMQRGSWSLQAFVRNTWMEYDNPALQFDGEALHSTHFNSEKGMQARWNSLFAKKILLHAGLEASLQSVNSSETGRHERQRFSAYSLIDWLMAENWRYFDSIHLNGGARLESYSDFGQIFLPSIALSATVKGLMFYMSAGKNYRAPTFNDLYWQPGGNPDLTAEKSDNYEIGMNYERSLSFFIFSLNGSLYKNMVSQQIKWLPGDSYWTPQNISSVKSDGFELQIDAQDINRIHKISFSYFYGNAVKTSKDFDGDNTAGNQLPYIPREKWSLNLSSGVSILRAGVVFSWNSFRYTTMENKDYLPSYYLLDIYSALKLKALGQQIELSLALNNILNTRYEVMNGYPMPPRNYQLSLRIFGKP